MALLFIVKLSVLTSLTVAEAGKVLVIPGGSPRHAALGSDITFTCALTDDSISDDPLITWYFSNNALTRCNNTTLTSAVIGTHVYRVCNWTVSPVTETSAGIYECLAFPGQELRETVQLNVNDSSTDRGDPIVHLRDPSKAAVLDDPGYGPVYVQSDTTRRFECRIQDARPGDWNFTWVLGNQEISTESEAGTGAGRVNVSSWHAVRNHGNETGDRNLTCLATSSDQSLSTTVLITFCTEPEYLTTVLRVLVSICVTVTIATIIAHVLLYRHYTS